MKSFVRATISAQPAETAEIAAWPHQPGWVDLVTAWVRRLPGPSWAFYLGAGLVLFTVETVVKWADRAYPVGTFFPFHVITAAFGVYFLAVIHYLDDVAGSALRDFRSVLQITDSDFARLHYRLTTMPARATFIATGVSFVVWNVLTVWGSTPEANAAIKLYTSPITTGLDYLISICGGSVWGVMIYHGLRQLRMVSRLYTAAPHLDLFCPGPLYAFAGLSARTSLSWLLIPYAAILAAPGTLHNQAIPLMLIPLTLSAILIFVAPLVGVHRILERQKQQLRDQIGQRMQAASVELQRRIDVQQFVGITELKDSIVSLVAVQDELSKLRTWPWQPGTMGGLGAALVLPLVIWSVQRILESLGF